MMEKGMEKSERGHVFGMFGSEICWESRGAGWRPLYGEHGIPRLVGFPEGRKQVLFRTDDFARVTVEREGGVTEHYVPKLGFDQEARDWIWEPGTRLGTTKVEEVPPDELDEAPVVVRMDRGRFEFTVKSPSPLVAGDFVPRGTRDKDGNAAEFVGTALVESSEENWTTGETVLTCRVYPPLPDSDDEREGGGA